MHHTICNWNKILTISKPVFCNPQTDRSHSSGTSSGQKKERNSKYIFDDNATTSRNNQNCLKLASNSKIAYIVTYKISNLKKHLC